MTEHCWKSFDAKCITEMETTVYETDWLKTIQLYLKYVYK